MLIWVQLTILLASGYIAQSKVELEQQGERSPLPSPDWILLLVAEWRIKEPSHKKETLLFGIEDARTHSGRGMTDPGRPSVFYTRVSEAFLP